MRLRATLITAASLISLFSCGTTKKEQVMTPFTKQSFGKTPAGEPVDLYTLSNSKGMKVAITNYGGIVVSIVVPSRAGQPGDVTLGFDTFEGYAKEHPFFGALVGRYGNRIAKGAFKLNGVEYKLARNNGENALHGGLKGFDKVVWQARDVSAPGAPALELSYLSKDGEEGYPGNLSVQVTYSLTEANELKVHYTATTDKDTPVNLTNHTYFNLAGTGDVLSHELTLEADKFTPVDKGLIPTGELRPVKGTPFDFTAPYAIGARITAKDQQIEFGGGYDHNWVLREAGGLKKAATVYEPSTGRVLEVFTTEPGIQFYTGNFLDGTITGKKGTVYQKRSGFCLETQHFPDSPNQPSFPSTILKAGGKYDTTTVFRFSVR